MADNSGIVRMRAYLIGALLCIAVIFMAHYSINVVHGSNLAIDHMPAGGIFVFFLLVLFLNPVIGMIKRTYALNSSELIIIYSMILVTSSITTMGHGLQLAPIIAAPFYYATSANRWPELIQPHLRSWLHPSGERTVQFFFEGLPPGESIPYMDWLRPVLAWFIFIFALYMVMVFFMVILRKQWVEKEKITFPLIQLPAEMIRTDEKSSFLSPLFRSKVFWVGFGLPVLISSINALHSYFHFIPEIQLAHVVEVFQRTTILHFRLSFPIMGFTYLINQEVALGVWFFNMLFFLVRGFFRMTGITSPEYVLGYGPAEGIFRNLGGGAFVLFVFMGFWMARRHLGEVFGKAFGRREADDSEEIVSYRTAVWGLIAGMLIMFVWLVAAGMNPGVSVLLLIFMMVFFIGLTRIISEAGVATMRAPTIAAGQVVSSVGSSAIGPESLNALGLSFIHSGDIRTFPMSAVAHGLKLSEWIKQRRKAGMFGAIVLAVLIGYFVSNWLVLRLAYTYGGINLNTWYFIGGAQRPYNEIMPHILHPTGPSVSGWITRGIGAFLMWVVMMARYRFLWWPFHPLGFAIGSSLWIDYLWFSIFIVWLVKALILKYGGVSLFRKGRPLFLGFILGQYSAAGLWFFIDLLTGHMGNQVFWI